LSSSDNLQGIQKPATKSRVVALMEKSDEWGAFTSSNRRQEESKIQLWTWGLADGKSGWIVGTKSDSTAGGNGCQRENDSRNSIDTGETRSCRTLGASRKVSRNVTARLAKMGDCRATLGKPQGKRRASYSTTTA
jgi:hypothetical protein